MSGGWDDAIIEMVRRGYSNALIMEATGMSRAGVSHAVRRLGLAGVRKQMRADRAEEKRRRIAEMRRAGATYEQIAYELGANYQDVAEIAQELGVGRSPIDERHGHRHQIKELGCKCSVCRAALLESKAEERARARKRARVGMVSHGLGGYHAGCLCYACATAYREQNRFAEQRETEPAAIRRGEVWDDDEIAEVKRWELSATEVALRIGRTKYGVEARRQVLRAEFRRQGIQPPPAPSVHARYLAAWRALPESLRQRIAAGDRGFSAVDRAVLAEAGVQSAHIINFNGERWETDPRFLAWAPPERTSTVEPGSHVEPPSQPLRHTQPPTSREAGRN